jgi:hypothetical protein
MFLSHWKHVDVIWYFPHTPSGAKFWTRHVTSRYEVERYRSELKPVFHSRIFSREAKFSFVFIQLVPDGSSWETKDKWKVENRLKAKSITKFYNINGI